MVLASAIGLWFVSNVGSPFCIAKLYYYFSKRLEFVVAYRNG